MTTNSVKTSMMRDIGVGDPEFKEIVSFIQKQILKIAGEFFFLFLLDSLHIQRVLRG